MDEKDQAGLAQFSLCAAVAGALFYTARGKFEYLDDFLVLPFAFLIASFIICVFAYLLAETLSRKIAVIEKIFLRKLLSVLLVIGFFFGQYLALRIVVGDNSAEVYSQEQLDDAKQEAFKQGAAKAVSYVQDYISFEYCRDDWRELSLEDEVMECENADDLYWLFDRVDENTSLMYNALEELMKLKGAEIAQWNIELDK